MDAVYPVKVSYIYIYIYVYIYKAVLVIDMAL